MFNFKLYFAKSIKDFINQREKKEGIKNFFLRKLIIIFLILIKNSSMGVVIHFFDGLRKFPVLKLKKS